MCNTLIYCKRRLHFLAAMLPSERLFEKPRIGCSNSCSQSQKCPTSFASAGVRAFRFFFRPCLIAEDGAESTTPIIHFQGEIKICHQITSFDRIS